MSWGYYGWRPYVPVAQRRAKAARELAKLAKKNGQAASPVVLEGRKIAGTFWGKAWCDNLEAYSDFANRLPRGRTYVRNGSVVDLQIGPGKVTARVSGSDLYRIEIKIKPLAPKVWKSIQSECAGKIDSLIELLQGKLSSAVMQVVTRQNGGLFPVPKEIELDCSCPDWADLCKHVAASLYGVGARLDSNPALLFILRGVDPADLISKVSAAEAIRQTKGTADRAPVMSDAEMSDVFGIELESGAAASPTAAETPSRTTEPLPPVVTISAPIPPATPARAATRRTRPTRRLSTSERARIRAALQRRWERAKLMALKEKKTVPLKARAAKTNQRRAARAGNAAQAE
jgi:uncharacterized Zn finger protein